MATTTNFGWTTPNDTDLVKDGAAAIRTLGSNIDTSLVDLKGGTTGQVLAKASGTDLDFTWATDASGIPATIFDAKGDIIAASAADTAARLAVGANNTVLTADSSTATGLKWAAPASAGKSYSLLSTNTISTGVATYTISGLSGYESYIFKVQNLSCTSGSSYVDCSFNGTSAFSGTQLTLSNPNSYSSNILQVANRSGDSINLGNMSSDAASIVHATIEINGASSTGSKNVTSIGSATAGTGDNQVARWNLGVYVLTATISSFTITAGSNFDAGTILVYGSVN